MNIVFLGGGSLRILPIVRALFKTPEVFDGGSIRLVDLKLERAEAVGKLIQRCPEFTSVNCDVSWTDDLDRALDGADLFYLTMAVNGEPSDTLAAQAAMEHGYLHSDQLSVNGAFLAARAGGTVMDFARKMETYCPDAMMLIFANPVAVYSAAVNNYTKIKALGICGGFSNHRWDLPRLCGRDQCETDWEVTAAGVNHLSFILRGEKQGQPLDAMLKHLSDPDWEPPEIGSFAAADRIREALKKMADIYRRFGTVIFSSEFDGMAHLLPDWALEKQRGQTTRRLENFNPDTASVEAAKKIDQKFTSFCESAFSAEEPDWHTPLNRNRLYGVDSGEISVPILRAMAGLGNMRITASYPNRGAVHGFPDNAALEYTMDLNGREITPVEEQYVPAPFKGIVASLSEHQTLLADAVAQQDGRLFADALEAYPVKQFCGARHLFFKRMFDIFADIPAVFRNSANYFAGSQG